MYPYSRSYNKTAVNTILGAADGGKSLVSAGSPSHGGFGRPRRSLLYLSNDTMLALQCWGVAGWPDAARGWLGEDRP